MDSCSPTGPTLHPDNTTPHVGVASRKAFLDGIHARRALAPGKRDRLSQSMRWMWLRDGLIDQLYDSVLALESPEGPAARGWALELVWPYVWLDGPLHAHVCEEPWTLARPHPAFMPDGLLVRLQARLTDAMIDGDEALCEQTTTAEHIAGRAIQHLIAYDRPVMPTPRRPSPRQLAEPPPPARARHSRRPRWLSRLRKSR